jgi:hypothetical protein
MPLFFAASLHHVYTHTDEHCNERDKVIYADIKFSICKDNINYL